MPSPKKTKAKTQKDSSVKKPKSWWGDDTDEIPPHIKWSGVTIAIEAIYNETEKRWESANGLYYFDEEAASKACDFFSTFLTHSKGEYAGLPFELLPWQVQLLIRPIFGWKRKVSGLRRFRKVYLEIPKKQGKSKLCGGIGLYMTFCDGEPGAEVVCAAADREQAGIVFDDAKAMVEDSIELSERSHVLKRSILIPSTRSTFKVLSADVKSKHGPNLHCIIFDELHVQKDRELFETLEKGIAARRQPLVVMITTAGDDQETICYEQHEYARSVMRDGGDDTFLPIIFGLKKTDDWTDPKEWAKVNPSLGFTVKEEYLEAEVNASVKDPRKMNSTMRLHFNIWTQQNKLWIPIDWWDACKRTIEEDSLVGLPVAGALDLSSKIDLCSFVLAFAHEEDETLTIELAEKKKFEINFSVTLLPFYWMPENSMTERKKTDRFGYDIMSQRGLVTLTEGDIIDYDSIYETIQKFAPIYHLKDAEIGFDPWNATQLSTQLNKDGFKMIEIPQTAKHLSEPAKIFEAMVKSKRIRHSGHPVLRWNIDNVSVKEDASGNIRPIKSSNMKRIDGVIASIMAISRLMVRKKRSKPVAAWI